MKEIKISMNGNADLLKYKNLKEERRKCIIESSSHPIVNLGKMKALNNLLHPKFFMLRVKEIILETEDTKTFILEPDLEKGTKKLPFFQAGQYITLEVPIDGITHLRAYSLSSNPKKAFQGEYAITIRKVPNGLISTLFFDSVKVGDEFLCHGPFGNFTYNPIRDAHEIIALAGGSGITPFLSMAEAILDGILDMNLTILYGAKKESDLIFQNRLNEITKKTGKVKVQYILSEENKEGFLNGFITKEMIESVKTEQNSYFVCGPISMYASLNTILTEMGIANKYIRHEDYPNFEVGTNKEEFLLTIKSGDIERKIPCFGNKTLLKSMEESGIKAPSRCGVGICGFCRSKLINGNVLTDYQHVRKADKKFKYIHPCATYPLSNVTIKLPK